jgi:SAM-dependent methyltransferase
VPTRTHAQDAITRAFRRWPWLLEATLGAMDAWYQVALLPFRRGRRRGVAEDDPDLVRRTDAYNDAAERYFASIEAPEFLLTKPFSEPDLLPSRLVDVGVLMGALRVMPGDVVLELGAGSCWLSHLLNRMGCRTVSVDVSKTALDLGRRLFREDPRTKWDLEPRFEVYDGHRLPLENESCDAIVVNDAFHHVPNHRELLGEMYRVLRPEGVVAMSEPGRGHGQAEQSLHETRSAGVLENELVIEDVAAIAKACGFDRVNVVISPGADLVEVPVHELGAFMGGKGFAAYWKRMCGGLERHHYLVCRKGAPRKTTRRPGELSARIDVVSRDTLQVALNTPTPVALRVTNTGDTTWLGSNVPIQGWTRIGAHLYRETEGTELVDLEWCRSELPSEVAPGGEIDTSLALPPIQSAGRYLVVIDLVVEQLTWFANRGSPTAQIRLHVA